MSGRVHMGLEKPTSIVAMLRIFFRPITAKGGCVRDHIFDDLEQAQPHFVVVVVVES